MSVDKYAGFAHPKPARKVKQAARLARGSRLARRGERGVALGEADAICADFALIRDGHECRAHAELVGASVPAVVVHHLARKVTHLGVEVRFRSGFLISLCADCHASEHGQRGEVDRLRITVERVRENRVQWHLARGGHESRVDVYDAAILSDDQIVGRACPVCGDDLDAAGHDACAGQTALF